MQHFEQFTEIECHSRYNRLVKARRGGQWYMLKGLKDQHAADPVMLELLRKEFNLGMLLRHVGVVDYVEMAHIPQLQGIFIVQEYVEGVTLKQWMEQPHTHQEKLDIVRQLAGTLQYCHSMNVVHRDIKPSNVMVTPNGHSVLIDFGLAVAANYDVFRAPAGTDSFMAPEQRRDDVVIDGRADLYALGRIMQEMRLPRRYNYMTKRLLQPDRELRPDTASHLLAMLNNTTRRRRWQLSAIAAVALAAGVFAAGYSSWGNQVLGVGQRTEAVLPGYLTADTMNHWAADTARYVTISTSDKRHAATFLKIGAPIPGPIDESVAVDLGLSVKWAPFNVGSDCPNLQNWGGFYGYGEPTGNITTTDYGNVVTYWSSNFGDYSGTKYDIARIHWGHRWRTPRLAEVEELLSRCQWTLLQPERGPQGYLVTGPNGNSIFLPLAGFRYNATYYSVGEKGYYWFTIEDPNAEYAADASGTFLWLKPEGIQLLTTIANNGFSVRPVLDK